MTGAAPATLVEVRDLGKTFPVRGRGRRGEEFVAVAGVSFSLAAGGSLAIVGESGAGKTTVARILVGLETQTSGVVRVCGRERGGTRIGRAERRRRAREIQIVFQDPFLSLDPQQRVGDAISEVLRLHFDQTDDERDRAIAGLLDRVGLDARHAKSLPRALSGGERQRVAIARALAVEPQVLVLDEAVSALDVSIQAQVLNLLADIRRETGTSYILISHDLAVVRQLTEEAVVMRRGEVVEAGPTDRVLESPSSEYTRLLKDAVPRPGWRPGRAT